MEGWSSICFSLLLNEIGLKNIYKKPPHWSKSSQLPFESYTCIAGGFSRGQKWGALPDSGEKAPWHTKGLIMLIVTLPHIQQLQRSPPLFILVQIKASIPIVCADFQLQTFACGTNKLLSLKLYTKESRFHIPPFSPRTQCPQQNTIWRKNMEVWHSWPYLCCAGLESFVSVS